MAEVFRGYSVDAQEPTVCQSHKIPNFFNILSHDDGAQLESIVAVPTNIRLFYRVCNLASHFVDVIVHKPAVSAKNKVPYEALIMA
jgi:hypothetical protein